MLVVMRVVWVRICSSYKGYGVFVGTGGDGCRGVMVMGCEWGSWKGYGV